MNSSRRSSAKPPHNVAFLERSVRRLAQTNEESVRLRVMMANVIAGQFLEGAVMRGGASSFRDFIKHLVEKPTTDHLVGLPSQAQNGTTQVVADSVPQVGCIAGLFAGSTVIDHLSSGIVSFIVKNKIHVKTVEARPLNATEVKRGFIFDASNAAIGVVACRDTFC